MTYEINVLDNLIRLLPSKKRVAKAAKKKQQKNETKSHVEPLN